MDAPPIPRLVDLVHVFKGVVVEQYKKRLEKLLSDSILLWRLLKLLFKILQQESSRIPPSVFSYQESYKNPARSWKIIQETQESYHENQKIRILPANPKIKFLNFPRNSKMQSHKFQDFSRFPSISD